MDTVKYWQPGQVEQVQEVGLYLQQQREARYLTVDAVSEKTRIRSGLISALESGHVDELPEPIYLRGFVKRYAEFLGLDGDSVAVSIPLPSLLKNPVSVTVPPIRVLNTPPLPRKSFPHKLIIWGTGTIALVLGIAYGVWYWSVYNPFQAKVIPESTPEPIATIAPTVIPEPVPQTLEFSLELTGDSWLEITIDGEVVVYETLNEGYSKTWTVKKELVLIAGQAENVKISLNGKTAQAFGEGYKEARFPVIVKKTTQG
ncbi:MAG: helix-turn-helix domain-containing protein [Prochlorotrichaceae cyanobacterium]